MTIVEALEGLWNTILDVTSLFVLPDWHALIGLLPIFVFLGVVGPLMSFFLLGTLAYQLRKPRVKVGFDEGPQLAALDDDGRRVYPPGLPHCRRDSLVYPSGAERCDTCREPLAVTCPMCGVGRAASLSTCGNCGLVLKIENRALTVRRGRPKPGGAAAA